MPSNRIYKFSDINEAQAFLNGGIIGRDMKGGVVGLVGLTLTFTSPSFSVTFAAVSPAPTDRDPYTLLFKDIKAQVEAANNDILVQSIGGKILFIEKTPTNGTALTATNQAAKALLGFDQAGATVGKFYKPPESSGDPNYVWAYSVNESTHVIYTWE